MNNKSRGYLYVVCALYLAYLTYGIITDYNGEIATGLHILMCVGFAAATIIIFYLGVRHILKARQEASQDNTSAGESITPESSDIIEDKIEGINENGNEEELQDENS